MARKANDKVAEPRNIPFTTKLSMDEATDVDAKALQYAKGKRSLYIRAALLNYKPKKEDFKC